MVKRLTVTAGNTGALPEALGTIIATDFGLSQVPQLKPGTNVVGLRNDGKQLHGINLVELAPGKTVGDVVKWHRQPGGPPPMASLGGVAVKPGEEGVTTLELKKAPFQREPFRLATTQLQPRLLVADAVGLRQDDRGGHAAHGSAAPGKSQPGSGRRPATHPRPGPARALVPVRFPPRSPRLSGHPARAAAHSAGRNPFTYFNRVIVSIDTLENPSRWRHHLERVRWDVVWIDESHKLVNRGTYNNALAHVLAPNADALILTSATPHNGKPESFAELVSLLDPTAVPNPER